MILAPEMAVYTEEDGMESAGPLTPVNGPVEYVRATALAEANARADRLEAALCSSRDAMKAARGVIVSKREHALLTAALDDVRAALSPGKGEG